MEYERKFKDAIYIAKMLLKDGEISQKSAERMFPELKESEDERIRKELIKLLKKMTNGIVENYTPVPLEDFVGWLEKLNLKGLSKEDAVMIKDIAVSLPKMAVGCKEILPSLAKEYSERLKALEIHCASKLEWSEEDEAHYKSVSLTINAMKAQFKNTFGYESDIKWLESLKDKLSNP